MQYTKKHEAPGNDNGKPSSRLSFLYQFDSLDEMADHADTAAAMPGNGEKAKQTGDAEFKGTYTFKEAHTLATRGWAQGRANMADCLSKGARTLNVTHRAAWLDVAGAFPIVPVAVSGDPLCMMTIGETDRATRPIIRLVVSRGALSCVTCEAIESRGAAILAWVDKLESEGARVEILCVHSTQEYAGKQTYTCAWNVKRAHEPLDIDRAAFSIVHTAAQRRISWAIMDATAGVGDNSTWMSSRGQSCDWIDDEIMVPASVYFPRLKDDDGYETPQKAVATITAIIEAGLDTGERMEGQD